MIAAAEWGMTGAVVELVKEGANLNLQDEVCQYIMYEIHVCECTIPTVS